MKQIIYIVYALWYAWKYKQEIREVNDIVIRFLMTKRITYQFRTIIKYNLMVIHNFI